MHLFYVQYNNVRYESNSVQAANELKLEPHKTIKLESNSQQGYFLRITKKVCSLSVFVVSNN